MGTSMDAVNNLVSTILRRDALEEAFNAFIVHESSNVSCSPQDELSHIINSNPESAEASLRAFVQHACLLRNHRQLGRLLNILQTSVVQGKLNAKQVCEALLSGLSFNQQEFWIQSLSLVEKLLPQVDYKGVRDLLKLLFDRAHQIPITVNLSAMRQLNVLQSLAEQALDRDVALCPSYLVLDDIQKRLLAEDGWPHWKFARLISSFVDSFRPLAQLVTIVGRSKLVPVVGHSPHGAFAWKIDPSTAKFTLKGQLPYNQESQQSQTVLLRYVLAQPYSRDMVCSMLGLTKAQKQRCTILENQLVDLMISAMQRSENEPLNSESLCQFWQNISTQLIYFVLFMYASFPDMVVSLHTQLSLRPLRRGRNHLMWVLLQFISGSIQKNPLNDFLPVLRLYDLLYQETEPLPFPDVQDPACTHQLAVTCIWVHLMKRAQGERGLQRPVPQALSVHLEQLQQALSQHQTSDYWTSLLCNAYSTNQEYFPRPMGVLVEAIQGGAGHTSPTQPLSMGLLDSLTVHTKMSLIHNIVTHVMKMAPPAASKQINQNQQNQNQPILSPALVETYSRLLVYNEIESLGIKGFITHLLPTVFRNQAWAILHTLLEMFSYRLHHIQPHYRVQLLSHLHSLAAVSQTNQTQLHVCIESTALKLITGLGSGEVQPQLSRFQSEPRQFLSADSEELNKAVVLTLARAVHVTGSESLSMGWCKDLLLAVLTNTPHSWSSLTLNCFPPSLAEFFRTNQTQGQNKAQLKRSVEEEYRKWKTMSNENDIVAHFSQQGTPHLFLCLLWKMLLENDRISPLAYKILDRLGARSLSLHLRTFADFLVYEVSNSASGNNAVNNSISALNDLVWKCYVIPLDRLVLCLALRSFEGNESQVCFIIIQMLLIRFPDFKQRVFEFVKENSPEHWQQSDWHEKHLQFQRKHPEKFYWENLSDNNQNHQYLPVYFGNICLRFLPVLDIVIHRFIELPASASNNLEVLLETLGSLYRFHDRPLTYLYNTLHYYEQRLRDRFPLKRKLVSSITGGLKDNPLTEQFQAYLKQTENPYMVPDMEYYRFILQRMVDSIAGKKTAPVIDWRFNEFSNPAAHTLHISCIEVMALPVQPQVVADGLLDVILTGHTKLARDSTAEWMNAIGLILTALPESYWCVLNERILSLIENLPQTPDIFQYMDLTGNQKSFTESSTSYIVALVHAVWYHASIGQISQIPIFVREKLKPLIKTEEQMLLLCQLVAPFFQRMSSERTRCLMDITRELYEILENVDKAQKELRYMDVVVDLFYHIKYMFTGDSVKADVEHIIRNLRPALQLRLRFITHLNVCGSTQANIDGGQTPNGQGQATGAAGGTQQAGTNQQGGGVPSGQQPQGPQGVPNNQPQPMNTG